MSGCIRSSSLIVLALAVLVLFTAQPGRAASPETDFIFAPDTGTITGYTGAGGVVEIPSTIGGVAVVAIGASAFSGNSTITSITLPTGVVTIGNSAFSLCVKLAGITIPSGVTTIGSKAFYQCTELASINLPDTLISIGDQAFYSCSKLVSINLPVTLTSIGEGAFSWSGLSSITIPSGVTSIGIGALGNCQKLTQILVDAANTNYSSDGVSLFNKDMTTLITFSAGTIGNYSIPDGVVTIGDSAFFRCLQLTGITLPSGVTTIGNKAFAECWTLASIDMSDTLIFIGDEAFYQCYKLASITIPSGATTIGNKAFWACVKLVSIDLPDTLTTIGDQAFLSCIELPSITIPSGVTSIGLGAGSAFMSCPKLTQILVDAANPNYSSDGVSLFNKDMTTLLACPEGTAGTYSIPDGVVTIGVGAFYYVYNFLTGISLPASLTTGLEQLRSCRKVTSVTVNVGNPNYSSVDGVIFSKDGSVLLMFPVGRAGFYSIPEGTTSVAEDVFSTTIITDITIPQSMTSIGPRAFAGAYRLYSITLPSTITSIGEEAFADSAELVMINFPPGLTSIGKSAFFHCVDLVSVTLPDSLTYIGDGAFARCLFLTSIVLPLGMTSIGDSVFLRCQRLKSISIPSNITSIGASAFNDCYSLTSVTIPFSVTSIGDGAFGYCVSLASLTVDSANSYYSSVDNVLFNKDKSVLIMCVNTKSGDYEIPPCVKTIQGQAFQACKNLNNIKIPESVTSIGDFAFDACAALSSINIPSGITSIGDCTFSLCYSLTNINIPEGVTSIGMYAFMSCPKLTSVTIPSTVDSIGDRAFSSCLTLTSAYFEGNAPSNFGGDVFQAATGVDVTIYYKSTSTGFTTPTWNGYNTAIYGDAYTVTYDGNGNTGGTVPPSNGYPANAKVTVAYNIGNLTKTGCSFACWNTKADGTGTAYEPGIATFTITADITLYAVFTANAYTLTYDGNGSTGGTVPPSEDYPANATVAVAANNGNLTKTGFTFTCWNTKSDGTGTAYEPGTATFTITSDTTLYAIFIPSTYKLAYGAGVNGSISGVALQTVDYGKDATEVTAVPSSGYRFVKWSDELTTPARTDKNVTANISVVASFVGTGSYSVIFIEGANGGISGVNIQTVKAGADCSQVEAIPNEGYNFSAWSGSYEGTENPLTIKGVSCDMAITANFAKMQSLATLTMAANPAEAGTISPLAGGYSVDTGVPQQISATATATGYSFSKWTANANAKFANANSANTTVTLTGDATVTANFTIHSYTLTYVAGANGSIEGTTPQTVNHSASGTEVTAVPETGYHFVKWSDDSIVNPRTDKNVTANISVTASFAINIYTLTYTAGTNGSIDGTTLQTVNHGASGTAVTAVPDTDCHFVNWSDGVTSTGRTDKNVTADISVTANFAIKTYTLTYIAGANGSISGTTPQTVDKGSSGVEVTAVPGTGYHFVNWSDGSTANPRTDKNVIANISVTASFAINTYTLTYVAETNGSISGTTPQTVKHGATGTAVTAVPDTGYQFVKWSDGVTTPSRTDSNVTADISVTANFAINTYILTYAAGANGSISGTTPQTVDRGASGTEVTAVPDTDYHFVKWSDDSTANPRTDSNVTADISVSANFAINTYTLTYVAGANGSISGTTPQTVDKGASGTAVTAVPDTGYHFVKWDDGSVANPRTDSNVIANVTALASFEINSYTITFVAGQNGTIDGQKIQTVTFGSDCSQVTAVPNSEFSFIGWTGDLVSMENPLIVSNITKNMNITANFGTVPGSAILTISVSPSGGGLSKPPTGPASVATLVPVSLLAHPAQGYRFLNWSSASATAFIENSESAETTVILIGDAEVTANFEVMGDSAQLTMESSPAEGGATSPVTGPVNTQVLVNVSATADTGYNFLKWTATANAAITNANSAITTVILNGDATVTANFAVSKDTVQLSLSASPAEGGTTIPDGILTVAIAQPQTITAEVSEGYYFAGWSADSAGAVFGDASAPETTVTVANDTVVSANFAESASLTDMACGRLYMHTGLASFTKNTKVYAQYTDPVKGGTPKKAAMKVLNKIKIATASVKCEWNGKIALFNKKLWDKTATCEENLLENPVDAMPSKLFVNGADTGVELSLVPPEISGVYDQIGSETYSATTGEMLTIKGTFFGVTPPAVWMEYPVYKDDGTTVKEIKCLRLKCYKTLKYKNSKGVSGKSCMDIETGLSEITVLVPKFPKNWDHSEYHNIVIDNKVGRATTEFQTEE